MLALIRERLLDFIESKSYPMLEVTSKGRRYLMPFAELQDTLMPVADEIAVGKSQRGLVFESEKIRITRSIGRGNEIRY